MISSNQRAVASIANPETLIDLLRFRADHQPERLAFTFLKDGETDEDQLTYGDLDRRARHIGARLQQLGATGKRVLLLYPAGLDYVSAFFGCLYAGAVAVPAYPPRFNRSIERLQAIVTDAQASAALTTTAMLSKVASWREQGSSPELTSLRWLNTDQIPANGADIWQEPDVKADSLAFLQYTSGSTGTPKGVMLSHRNLLANSRTIQHAFRHTEHAMGVSWLPLYHDMGLIGGMLQPLYVGFPCVLMSPMAFLQRPCRWLQAISHYRATTSGAPNFAYDLCVRKITPAQRQTLDLRSWQVAFSGAEPVRQETLERFAAAFAPCGLRRAAFLPCYGLAEATLMVSGGQNAGMPITHNVQRTALAQHRVTPAPGTDDNTQTLVSCGRVPSEQRVRIVDPVSQTACQPDEVGEIWLAGPHVAQGYWNRPALTAQTFQATLADTGEGPFLRTGDLGFLHRGELFITGRLKDVIIMRGQNHYPQDIEMTVESCHPSIRPGCGAAFAVDIAGEERLVVVQEVERRQQAPQLHHPERRQVNVDPGFDPIRPPAFDAEATIAAIRRAVAEQHGIQSHAIVLLKAGSMPKTSSGKIQRFACKAGFLSQTLDTVGAWQAALEDAGQTSHAPSKTPRPPIPRAA